MSNAAGSLRVQDFYSSSCSLFDVRVLLGVGIASFCFEELNIRDAVPSMKCVIGYTLSHLTFMSFKSTGMYPGVAKSNGRGSSPAFRYVGCPVQHAFGLSVRSHHAAVVQTSARFRTSNCRSALLTRGVQSLQILSVERNLI